MCRLAVAALNSSLMLLSAVLWQLAPPQCSALRTWTQYLRGPESGPHSYWVVRQAPLTYSQLYLAATFSPPTQQGFAEPPLL